MEKETKEKIVEALEDKGTTFIRVKTEKSVLILKEKEYLEGLDRENTGEDIIVGDILLEENSYEVK